MQWVASLSVYDLVASLGKIWHFPAMTRQHRNAVTSEAKALQAELQRRKRRSALQTTWTAFASGKRQILKLAQKISQAPLSVVMLKKDAIIRLSLKKVKKKKKVKERIKETQFKSPPIVLSDKMCGSLFIWGKQKKLKPPSQDNCCNNWYQSGPRNFPLYCTPLKIEQNVVVPQPTRLDPQLYLCFWFGEGGDGAFPLEWLDTRESTHPVSLAHTKGKNPSRLLRFGLRAKSETKSTVLHWVIKLRARLASIHVWES